jgi:drug/metabolite transporter (DMT)-like permease
VNRRLQADFWLASCSLIWGATFVVVKGALADASVFVFLALRFALAAVALAVIYYDTVRRMNRGIFWAGTAIGWFMFAGYALQTIGLKYTTPSKAAFITGMSVVMVPVLHAILAQRSTGKWVWAGAIGALVGLYFLAVPKAGLGDLNKGDLWELAAAIFWAVHILVVDHCSPGHSVGALTFMQVAVSAVLTTIFLPAVWAVGWETPRVAWTENVIAAVLITALGATAIAFSIQVWAQRFTTPSHVAILFSLEPVFAALTSFVVYGKWLSGREILGAALLLAGILAAELKGPPATPEGATAGFKASG